MESSSTVNPCEKDALALVGEDLEAGGGDTKLLLSFSTDAFFGSIFFLFAVGSEESSLCLFEEAEDDGLTSLWSFSRNIFKNIQNFVIKKSKTFICYTF